jgi:xylose isomerase
MKNTIFIFAILLAAAFSGCGVNKDAEVKAFVTDVDQLTTEIVRTIDAKPGAGVDEAQKMLDARKDKLKTEFEKLKKLRGYELSREMTEQLTEALTKNIATIASLQIKYAEKSATDIHFGKKLDKLATDYNSIFEI